MEHRVKYNVNSGIPGGHGHIHSRMQASLMLWCSFIPAEHRNASCAMSWMVIGIISLYELWHKPWLLIKVTMVPEMLCVINFYSVMFNN